MKWSKWVIGFTLLLCLPNIGFAETLFAPPPLDKSVQYLGTVFGPVGDLPVSGGDATLSVLMRLINQIVLSLGFLIIGWTVFVSSIKSAQEGEVMGKKWSSIWMPIRSIVGMYLLLPTASGYSYIQISVMWFILQSIGAADALWNQVLTSWQQNGSINQQAAMISLNGGSNSIYSIFKSKVCEAMLNKNSSEYNLKERISFFQQGSQGIWGYSTYGTNVCGAIDLSPILGEIQGKVTRTTPITEAEKSAALQSYFYAVDLVQLNLATAANEAVSNPPERWSNYLSLVNGVIELRTTISNALQTSISSINPPANTLIDTSVARDFGWIHAGGFYFNLVQGTSSSSIADMQFTAPLSDMSGLCTEKGDFCPALPNKIITIFGQYIDFISNNISSQNSQNAMVQGFSNNLNSTPPAVQSAMAPLSNAFKGIITKFISGLTGNNGQIDPLVALMTMGQDIMLASEIAIWICIGVFVLLALTSIMSSVQPAGWLVDSVVSMAVTIILFLTFLLWGAGLTIGLYLPLIPYLLFLFGGLAWMILVIEAMVASPLIALSLIVPSEDEIGKAAGALIILVGLFFRPILMIVGFVFAAKLLMVAVAMLNYGFENILNHTILGLGLFGSIAVIILYAGILISIVHEAFSLIYVLPEKALRWMGASGDGVDIASKLQKVEGAVDAGAKTSMGVAKGATSAAMKLSK